VSGKPAHQNPTISSVTFNKSVENNSGQYYIYTVIPEFTATMFLLILLLSTTVIFIKKKIAKNKKK